MKLIILFFIVLTFDTSWQEESTETLNETLDRLIKQTNLGDHRENNPTTVPKNNSRIFYLNSQDINKDSDKETTSKERSINIDDNNQVSIKDILRALGFGGSLSADDDNHNVINTNHIKEITVTRTVEDPKLQITNSASSEISELSKEITSKSGRIPELDDNAANVLANLDINLLHKYPEIIIDKVTYHNDKKAAEEGIEPKAVTAKVDQVTEKRNNYPLAIAQELKTILDELKLMKATETASKANSQRNDQTDYIPAIKVSRDDAQQPCGDVLVPYSAPCKTLLLSKLLEYQNLLNTDPDINTSLQLNIWGARNARQNALMRISRTQKLKRIHFITRLINNMMSNFVYRPFYGYN